jgi:long-chain fatty acid transport protein
MAGASAALPLDTSTIVSNPSGLSALEQRVDLAGTAFMPSPEYSADWSVGGPTQAASQSSDRPTDFLPTLGAVYRTTDDLSVGVVALGTAGMGVEYPAAGGTGHFGGQVLTSYTNFRVAPAVGYRLSDRLSVGLAVNLMWATMKYNVLEQAGVSPRDTANSFGVGGTIGLTFRAPENITLGVAYESRSYFQPFEFDIPAHQQFDFSTGTQVPIPGGTEKLAFDQPDVVTLGAAFHPLEALLVATDFQWIRWSTTNGVGQPELQTDPNVTGAPTFNLSWKDQVVFKIGAQYEVNKEVKVRAGYNYGSAQLDATRAFENLAFPAVSKHHFTVGGGYSFGTIAVNAAILYSPVESISGSNVQQGIPSYETKMSQLAFDLGASWKF